MKGRLKKYFRDHENEIKAAAIGALTSATTILVVSLYAQARTNDAQRVSSVFKYVDTDGVTRVNVYMKDHSAHNFHWAKSE